MKNNLFITLAASILLGSTVHAADGSPVDVIINGKVCKFSTSPRIVSGRTEVPAREVMDVLGGKISWDSKSRSITMKDGANEITLKMDDTKAIVNDKEYTMDVAPFILNDRAMVPLRFIASNLNMNVEWVDELNSVTLTRGDYFATLSDDVTMGFTVSYYNNDNLSYTSVKNNKDLNMIAVFNYSFDMDDNIKVVDVLQKDTVSYANDNDIIPLAVVHNIYNGNFNQELLHNMLVDEIKRQSLIHNILLMVIENGYGGVNIDFENIGRSDKDLFTTFVRELKEELSRHGYITTVCVPAKTSDAYTSSWNYAFDYAKIGEIADYIIIMAYDEHYVQSEPGAIASINWVKDVLDYAKKTVSEDKIILGLALYGYDWSNGKGVAVPSKNCKKLATDNNVSIQWDKRSMSPYFSYTKDNIYHEVWYEDNDSLNAKIDLIRKYKLAGIGFWRLGLEINGVLPK